MDYRTIDYVFAASSGCSGLIYSRLVVFREP